MVFFFPDLSLRLKNRNLKINFYNLSLGTASFNPTCTGLSLMMLHSVYIVIPAQLTMVNHFIFNCSTFSEIRQSFPIEENFQIFIVLNLKKKQTHDFSGIYDFRANNSTIRSRVRKNSFLVV